MTFKEMCNQKWFVTEPSSTEFEDNELVVVREGYINKDQQILELKRAGQNLEDYRAFYYYGGYPNDGNPEESEEFEDVTMRHDFDFEEAARLTDWLTNRAKKAQREAQKARKEFEKAKVEKDALEASEGLKIAPQKASADGNPSTT